MNLVCQRLLAENLFSKDVIKQWYLGKQKWFNKKSDVYSAIFNVNY